MTGTKKKKMLLSGVITLSAAALLSGTVAFTDMTQNAVNVFSHHASPDVTLHDDFDGENKDIYAENTGTSDMYIRIRLNEYMRIGETNFLGENLSTTLDPVTSSTKDRWLPHTYAGSDSTQELMGDCGNAPVIEMHSYYQWNMSGAQIKYKSGDPGEVASDLDGVDAAGKKTVDPNSPTDTKTTSAAHAPQLMSRYVELSGRLAAGEMLTGKDETDYAAMLEGCWLLDDTADEANGGGWAYWSVNLKPDTATNLLLDSVTLKKKPEASWFYAIDVKMQAATLGDTSSWGIDGNRKSAAADSLIASWGN